MSALGHKRTFAVQNGMSALPPIADICSAQAHVRLCQKRTCATHSIWAQQPTSKLQFGLLPSCAVESVQQSGCKICEKRRVP